MKNFDRILTMAVLCLSGGIIFMLPFLREIYYIPMQNAFGYTNTQMGVLMSVFGTMSMIGYFPGGWLADLFSPRKLMASALLTTGLVGHYFSTMPSYEISLLIHAFWGLSISMVFWSAMIKATRNWASHEDQGKAFGFLEGGRGVAEGISGAAFGAVFILLGSTDTALTTVINLYAITNIGLAILVWFTFSDQNGNETETDTKAPNSVNFADVISVLKLPVVWLISLVIMTAYSGYWGTYYFAPFATSAFGMSVAMGVMVGVGKTWVSPVAAMTTGFIADKIGISRAVYILLTALVVLFLILGLIPHSPSMVYPMLITVAVTAYAVYAIRGIYFALLEESGIPARLTGTAAGVVSVLGFMPDIYMPFVGGVLLDAFSEAEGYRYYYIMISGMCLVGAVAAYTIKRKNDKLNAEREHEA